MEMEYKQDFYRLFELSILAHLPLDCQSRIGAFAKADGVNGSTAVDLAVVICTDVRILNYRQDIILSLSKDSAISKEETVFEG